MTEEKTIGDNTPEFGVADLSRHIKGVIEGSFGHVRVRGEIGSCTRPASGHLYISLKEDNAVLAAICWRGKASKLSIVPETGMEVICTGSLTTYDGQSKYQMIIDKMELAGEGALLKMLEERRKRLAAEGLFDEDKKKKLPFLPKTIGVVTSPTGAVIRDILHRLEDRFPTHVLVWPVLVQGEGAADQITKAIDGFNAMDNPPDLIIVARGGGSLEDLMAFNEENVIRAAANSKIPLISAVGHETDTTLIDYASDRRAPTPTAAAEIAVPVRRDLWIQLRDNGNRLEAACNRLWDEKASNLNLLSRAIGDPARALEPLFQRFDERAEALTRTMSLTLERAQTRLTQAGSNLRHPRDIVQASVQRLQTIMHRLETIGRTQIHTAERALDRASTMLEALSPHAVLGRGYSLVYDEKGNLITKAKSLTKGQNVNLTFQDESRKAKIED